jgi:putative membrane protein
VWAAVRRWFDPEQVRHVGTTPDYRFSLANERTFLAWIRTGLALVGGGLAVAQVLTAGRLRTVLAVGLLVLGAAVAVRAISHWVRCEIAMRLGRDLPSSRFPAVLATVLAVGALALLVAVLAGGLGR